MSDDTTAADLMGRAAAQEQAGVDQTGLNRAPGHEIDDANRAAKQERIDDKIAHATESPNKTGDYNPMLDRAAAEWAAKAGMGEAVETVADLKRDPEFRKAFAKGDRAAMARMEKATVRSLTPEGPREGADPGADQQQKMADAEHRHSDPEAMSMAHAATVVNNLRIAHDMETTLADIATENLPPGTPLDPHQKQQIAETVQNFTRELTAGVAVAAVPNEVVGQMTTAMRAPDFASDANMLEADQVEADYIAIMGQEKYNAALQAANGQLAKSPWLFEFVKKSDAYNNPVALRTLVEWGRGLI